MKLGLAGDTMLGRKVAERLSELGPARLFDEGLTELARSVDLLVCNLECAISDRGEPWPDPDKPFFFRAPPVAAEVLAQLGVGCVTLANNHALDFGPVALLDTCRHLADAGIACVGAGADEEAAHLPARLMAGGIEVAILGVTDHPSQYAAGPARPGVAFGKLGPDLPTWVHEEMAAKSADVLLVSPHWGPNMVAAPIDRVRAAAAALLGAGASLVAGHSAHVFHGVAPRILYDLGDFVDDYASDPELHNELGLFWIVSFDGAEPVRVEAVPLALDYCRTRLANEDEATFIRRRFRRACAALGTEVGEVDGRLVIDWTNTSPLAPVANS